MVKAKEYMKYFFVLFFVIVLYLSFIIIKPFLSALLMSAILAYIFYPVYSAVVGKVRSKNLSAFIVSLIIIMLISLPALFALNTIANESQYIYVRARQKFVTGDIIGTCADGESGVCRLSDAFSAFIANPRYRFYLQEGVRRSTDYITAEASSFILSLPRVILIIFITFFTTFYLFKDGKHFLGKIKDWLPLRKTDRDYVVKKLSEMTHAVVYGTILIAVIQGAAGALGFFIFGVNSPLLWGILMALFALVPLIGTPIIWGPVGIFIILEGLSIGQTATITRGVGLLIYGVLVISLLDNILKPYVIGKRAKIHPVLVLVGVLGGIAVFGFPGFIIGPLVLALLATLLEIYEKEKKLLLS